MKVDLRTLEKCEVMPSQMSMGKSALREFGGDLTDQYNSGKWDCGSKHRPRRHCSWKLTRHIQYRRLGR